MVPWIPSRNTSPPPPPALLGWPQNIEHSFSLWVFRCCPGHTQSVHKASSQVVFTCEWWYMRTWQTSFCKCYMQTFLLCETGSAYWTGKTWRRLSRTGRTERVSPCCESSCSLWGLKTVWRLSHRSDICRASPLCAGLLCKGLLSALHLTRLGRTLTGCSVLKLGQLDARQMPY